MIWNAKDRQERIQLMQNNEFDIIIIGGGITGAGVAREAALRGLTFCLLDKNDYAFGTSSRSSKLIHGGLRYLATAEFKLVRESTTERNWLRNHFSNLVRPLGFMYCSYEKGKDKPFMVKFAITLYNILSDWFSPYKNYKKGIFLKPDQIRKMEPAVITNDPELGKLLMAGFYFDNNVDDSRLTIETIKESLEYSTGKSVALSYSKVNGLVITSEGKVSGVNVTDVISGAGFTVKGKAVVSCAGIWTDEIMKGTASYQNKIYPTKGVHVVVPNERIGNRNAFGIRSFDDGRFFFILRRGNVSVIGTTDTDYYKESKNLDEPKCTQEDCDYLLRTVNRLFPDAKLTYNDIIGTYAGIRPLIRQSNAKSESDVSREHEIIESPEGIVALAGGKLTTFRVMAEQLLFYLVKKGQLDGFKDKKHYRKGFSRIPFLNGITQEEFDQLAKENSLENAVDTKQSEYIYQQYGRKGIEILRDIKRIPEKGIPLVDSCFLCRAELEYILKNEDVNHLTDILCRRTEAQWNVCHQRQGELAEKVSIVAATVLGWNEERRNKEIWEYLDYVKKTIWF